MLPIARWSATSCSALDCNLEAFPDVIVGGITSSSGTYSYPLPVPIHPALPGFHVYAQYLFQGTTMGAVTKGLDINVQQ